MGTGEGELYADPMHWPAPRREPGAQTVPEAAAVPCPRTDQSPPIPGLTRWMQRTVSLPLPPAEEQNTIFLRPAGRNSDGMATVLVHRGHILGGQRAELEAPVPPDCTAAAPTGPHSPRRKRETSVSHREGAVFPVSTTHS